MLDPKLVARLADAIATFEPEIRRMLLRVLLTPPEGRARRIGQLYQDPGTRNVAELLIDCEIDRRFGVVVADALRESLRR